MAARKLQQRLKHNPRLWETYPLVWRRERHSHKGESDKYPITWTAAAGRHWVSLKARLCPAKSIMHARICSKVGNKVMFNSFASVHSHTPRWGREKLVFSPILSAEPQVMVQYEVTFATPHRHPQIRRVSAEPTCFIQNRPREWGAHHVGRGLAYCYMETGNWKSHTFHEHRKWKRRQDTRPSPEDTGHFPGLS